jgi:hypothetical protein
MKSGTYHLEITTLFFVIGQSLTRRFKAPRTAKKSPVQKKRYDTNEKRKVDKNQGVG